MKNKAVSFLLGVFLQKKLTPFIWHGAYLSTIAVLSALLLSQHLQITIN